MSLRFVIVKIIDNEMLKLSVSRAKTLVITAGRSLDLSDCLSSYVRTKAHGLVKLLSNNASDQLLFGGVFSYL